MYSSEEIDSKLQQLVDFESAKRHQGMVLYGVNVWPLLRSELQFNILRSKEEYASIKDQPFKNTGIISSLKLKAKLWMSELKIKRYISELRLPTQDVALFSPGNAYYTDQVKGKLYNRHLDPFLEELKSLGMNAGKLHVITEAEVANKYAPSSVVMLTKEIQDYIWNYSFYLFQSAHSNNLTTALEELEINPGSVYKRIRFILGLKRVLKMMLKQMKVQVVGMVCFYDDYCFALSLAAKELGIKTIDIQHGKQGEKHFCYTHYVSSHGNLRDMMPDCFWNWGMDSVNNVRSYLHNKSEITCIPGGNLWLAKWKTNDFYMPTENDRKFADSLSSYEKVFLYSAQPIGDFVMPEFLKTSIQRHPQFFFCIRIHPREKSNIHKYIQEFASFSNVEITLSSELPLYYLLNFIDVSLTRWSSVALESLNFGCESWVVDSFGVSSFQTYIDKGSIKAVLSEADFDTALNFKNHIFVIESIITDKEKIRENLVSCFSHN